MSLGPSAPPTAPAFTADEERPITGRPFLVPLYVPHFTARSRPGGFSPFYRSEPLSSGPEARMYHLTAHGNSRAIAGTAMRAYPKPIEPWITAPAATATARAATTVTIDVRLPHGWSTRYYRIRG